MDKILSPHGFSWRISVDNRGFKKDFDSKFLNFYLKALWCYIILYYIIYNIIYIYIILYYHKIFIIFVITKQKNKELNIINVKNEDEEVKIRELITKS
ncbi:MAG: hypothetical protein KJ559_03450 [Nanoarchaeota archaeon]|nr:hypothetical protein [Nanoarchaeota archaeon]